MESYTYTRKEALGAGAAGLGVLYLVGCGGGKTTSSAAQIVIGDTGSTSGGMASYDQPASTGVQIAIREINAKGGLLGRPLKYVHVDGKSDPNEGARAAAQVLDDGAQLVILTCDFDLGAPAALQAEERKTVSFSQCGASTNFGPPAIGPHNFTMATPAPTQGSIAAEFMFNHQNWTKVWSLLDNTLVFFTQMHKSFVARYEELGGQIVGSDTFQQQDPQIGPQITSLKSLTPQPDALILFTYQPGLAQVLRQIRAAGINQPVFGSCDFDGTFWHETVPNVKDVFFEAYGNIQEDPNPKVNQFFKTFASVSGGPPPTAAALTGYSIVQAWALAVNKAGTIDGDAVAKALESFRDVPLLVGPTSFTPQYHWQTNRSMSILEVTKPNTIQFVTNWKPSKVALPEQ